MNSITGAQSADAESAYSTPTLTASQVDDASYNYSLIVDACADAEMMVVQTIAQIANHPWHANLRKGTLAGLTGTGLQNGDNIYTAAGAVLVKDCVGLGPVVTLDLQIPLREKPTHEIVRRNRNAGSYFTLPVYYYRIVDNLIYHTVPDPGVVIQYFAYERNDTYTAITGAGKPLFPESCIPAYVAGACSMLLKEEEYAGQCQYYSQLFTGMLQTIAQGFAPANPMQEPTPVKGTEAT